MKNNDDVYQNFLDLINNPPAHSGWDLKGLRRVLEYYSNLILQIKFKEDTLDNTQTQQLMLILRTNAQPIVKRINEITGKDKYTELQNKSRELMKILDVKYGISGEDSVKITDLYNIFMDEEKLQELISKIKLKAFW